MNLNNIGIVGAGAMGSGIAQVAAQAGCKVHIHDSFPESLIKSKTTIQQNFNKLVEKGKLEKSIADSYFNNIVWTDNIQELSASELIIEAIIEEIAIKKKLFSELEQIVSEQCILASNTSSLSITAIASACKNAERVIGIHFFNPAPIMELVEIIPAIQTKSSVTDLVLKNIQSWKKTTVVAKDTPGFIVNRIARPYYSEALRIYDEGIASIETIDYAMTNLGGFKMGPFTLMDFIGHDVNFRVTESVYQSFYNEPRYKPSFSQKRLFEAGWLGKKSGKGFYDYTNPSTNTPHLDPTLNKIIFERILFMLINEAADALHWQVASKEDIDLAMLKGVNYPKGLVKWADEIGIAHCVSVLDTLYEEYHEDRYRCSPILRKKAILCETFY